MRNWSPLPIRASSNSPRSHHSQSHTLRKHARIAASRTHRSIQLSKESRPAEINLTLEPNKKNLFGHKKSRPAEGRLARRSNTSGVRRLDAARLHQQTLKLGLVLYREFESITMRDRILYDCRNNRFLFAAQGAEREAYFIARLQFSPNDCSSSFTAEISAIALQTRPVVRDRGHQSLYFAPLATSPLGYIAACLRQDCLVGVLGKLLSNASPNALKIHVSKSPSVRPLPFKTKSADCENRRPTQLSGEGCISLRCDASERP